MRTAAIRKLKMSLELTSLPKVAMRRVITTAAPTIHDSREHGHLTGCNVELSESSEISAHHVKCSLQCKWTLGQGIHVRSI